MAIDWFRSYHGAPTDKKWLVIARRADVTPGVVAAVWWALMDHASQAAPRGDVSDFDAESVAAFYGWPEDQVGAVVAALTEKKLINGGVLTNWPKRNPKREDDSTERVQRYRAKAEKEGWPSRHIPSHVRRAVMERDSGTCRSCGSPENPEMDHVVSPSQGGESTVENLRILCRTCNRRRTALVQQGRDLPVPGHAGHAASRKVTPDESRVEENREENRSLISLAGARLREWLGEHAAAVDRFERAADHSGGCLDGIFALYQDQGTDAKMWAGLPPPARPQLLAAALDRYAAERIPYNSARFAAFLRRVVSEHTTGANGRSAAGETRGAPPGRGPAERRPPPQPDRRRGFGQ